MWVIKKVSTGELHVWQNARTDNFQMYIPTALNTTQEDLEFYLCCDNCCAASRINSREYDAQIESGEVVLKEYQSADFGTEEAPNDPPIFSGFIKNHPTTLVPWPYNDETGEFTPPEPFIPGE
jgi:hypothetical protein